MSWRLPGYVVESLVGVGGSGEVWRGRAAATGEAVALKRLRIESTEQLRDGRTEAAILAKLDHPNLVGLHDVVALPDTDSLVLVLDYADGGSLEALIAARGRLTPGEVIAAMAPIGAALAYAHTAGVVHGDVTPANVLFTDLGLPLLADLGVARITGDTKTVRSTPSHIDPLVAAGDLPGPHSDVFMVAAVALHALTGQPLWQGATAEAVLAAAAAGEIDVAGRLAAADVPRELAAVLETALQLDPSRRGTAAEFALELRHSGEPVAVELQAGRPRAGAVPPVAPVRPADAEATPPTWLRVRPAAAPLPDPDRPFFDRPVGAATGPVPSSPALTRGVRARPVALRPTPRPLWRRSGVVGAAVVCVAAVVVAAVALSSRSPGVAAPPASRTGSTALPAGAVPVKGAAAAAAELSRLDAFRALAFARRDPSLLRSVYLSGPLLRADAALLARLVPRGCGLLGARTSYRDVVVISWTADQIVVMATVTLARSQLRCAGTDAGEAPGLGPQRLRIRLVPTGRGYRVASQQRT